MNCDFHLLHTLSSLTFASLKGATILWATLWRGLDYKKPREDLANIQQGTESLSVERSRLQGTKGKRLWSTSSKELRLSIQRWQVSPSTNGTLPKHTWWVWNWSHSQLSPLDDHSFSWHLNCSLWETQSQKTQLSCSQIPESQKLWDNASSC